jgi:hypothetical protein
MDENPWSCASTPPGSSSLLLHYVQGKSKPNVFRDVTPCSLGEAYRRFGRTYCLRLQGRRIRQACNQQKHGGKLSLMIKVIYSSETSISLSLRTMPRYKPKDHNFQSDILFSIQNINFNSLHTLKYGACRSVVGSGTTPQAGRSRVQLPMISDISIYLIFQAALWPWGRLKPLREMRTKNLPGGEGRPAGA